MPDNGVLPSLPTDKPSAWDSLFSAEPLQSELRHRRIPKCFQPTAFLSVMGV